jgi:DNA-directed RNA polymerase subunit K/omega
MFQRARQLRNGSRPRINADGHKEPRIAFLEITSGAVPWEIHAGSARGSD